MTYEERLAHVYKVGDWAQIVDNDVSGRTWSKYGLTLPVGHVFQVTDLDLGLCFVHQGLSLMISKKRVEPRGAQTPCSCPTYVLMASGCQCGGA